jgi:hypothetical protein
MKRITIVLLACLLFLTLAGAVYADNGRQGKFVMGGSYTLNANENLYGDLVIMGGSAKLEKGSTVNGNVVIMGGSVDIAGTVTESVSMFGGSVHLQTTAIVNKDIITVGGSLTREEGARVGGDTVEGFRWNWQPNQSGTQVTPQVSFPENFWSPLNLFRQMMQAILTMLGLMALGVLVVLLLPNQTAQVTQVVASAPVASLGVGLLSLVVIPILMVLLIITCIGPFILALAALVAGLFGWLAVGLFVGNKILHALNTKETSALVAVVLGIALITLVSEIPCIGWLFGLLIASLGLGAVILTRFGTTTYPWPAAPTAPVPPAAPSAPQEGATPTAPKEWHGNI